MKLILISFLVFLNASFNEALGQNCNSQFSSHKNGAIITNWPESMSGIAKVPIGGHVWVLVQPKGFNGWVPQGNGERNLNVGDSIWYCDVHLGDGTQTGFFDIAIAIVNDEINKSLNDWVSKANDTRKYPGIQFPGLLSGCTISRITVEKR